MSLNEGLLSREQRRTTSPRHSQLRVGLNEGLLSREQRPQADAIIWAEMLNAWPQRRAALARAATTTLARRRRDDLRASTKGCSRESSDLMEALEGAQRDLGLNEGLLSREQRPAAWLRHAASRGPRLNEGLLSREQRPGRTTCVRPRLVRASTKGCSRESSDGDPESPRARPRPAPPQRRAALARAATERRRLLTTGADAASTKGCSRESSDAGRWEVHAGWGLASTKGCSRESSDAALAAAGRKQSPSPQRRAALARAALR